MSLLATLEALEKADASKEVILAVVRAHLAEEEARLSKRRSQDAARQKAKRSRDVRVTPRDSDGRHVMSADSSPRARVRDNSPKLVTTGFDAADDASASSDDWPSGSARDLAKHLIAETGSPWLDPNKSLDLNTTIGRIAAWKRDGASWRQDVLPVVAKLCERNRKPVKSWKFFDAAVAQSIADNRAALEIPLAQPRSTGPPSLSDRIAADNRAAEQKAFAMLDAQNGKTD